MADTCGSCKHYIGGGDWNLCCSKKYDLCYETTPACDLYEYSEAKVLELEERKKGCWTGWKNKEGRTRGIGHEPDTNRSPGTDHPFPMGGYDGREMA